jgi:dienelactone hydrolase
MTTHTSKACCERPAAISEGYNPKGAYHTIANTKCYITGPKVSRKAIYVIYDVFGYTSPTLQGADILAAKGKEPYLVIVPDVFDGNPVQLEWFADRDKPEHQQKIGEYMSRLQDPKPHVQRVLEILEAAKGEFTSVERWGTIGCK